jgi:hypothetical protein
MWEVSERDAVHASGEPTGKWFEEWQGFSYLKVLHMKFGHFSVVPKGKSRT